MSGWIARYEKRRRELAEGADEDLVQANRRRSRLALSLISLAFVLGLIDAKFRLPSRLDIACRIRVGTCGVVGIVLARWAQREREFLTSPDPEGPPEIFKDRGE